MEIFKMKKQSMNQYRLMNVEGRMTIRIAIFIGSCTHMAQNLWNATSSNVLGESDILSKFWSSSKSSCTWGIDIQKNYIMDCKHKQL